MNISRGVRLISSAGESGAGLDTMHDANGNVAKGTAFCRSIETGVQSGCLCGALNFSVPRTSYGGSCRLRAAIFIGNASMDILEQELASQHPRIEVNRRGFIMTALASGFAAAVQPVSAQTITTDANGLTAGPVSIPVPDGTMPAYRAQPEGKTGLPTVLVVQEVFGVHEHIKDLCRRLAKRGYLAVAPELYARQGDPSKAPSVPVLIETIVSKVPDAQVMSDLDSTASWARDNNGSASKLAITGFCWGGRIVWLYTAHNPAIKAGAAWYGPLATKNAPLQPLAALDIAAQLKAPVLGQYGGLDQGITADQVAAMRAALEQSPAPANASTIIVYPDAQHGFNADYRPSYNKADAEVAWQRMLDWFAKYGVS